MDHKTENHIWSMPGISEVWVMDADDIQSGVVQAHIAGLDVTVLARKRELMAFGDASCEVETSWENNAQKEKATLQFTTTSVVIPRKAMAWLIKDVTGQWWLMGSKERPWPTTTVGRNLGSPGDEKAARRVKATLESLVALIPVAVL